MRFLYSCKGCGAPLLMFLDADFNVTDMILRTDKEACQECVYTEVVESTGPPFVTERTL